MHDGFIVQSLSGHTTPVECVQFGHTEELVCAGSQTGALKIWDLEAAKIVRTLTGHKATIRCMDFHPYGDFLTSGSLDTSIKVCKYKHVCLPSEMCCIIRDESGSARGQLFSCQLYTEVPGFDSRLCSVWDLWWRDWHWDGLWSDYFTLPVSSLFGQCSIPIFYSCTTNTV